MSETFELYSKVLLKTGETGIIVEIFDEGEGYLIELPPSNEEFLRFVNHDQIEKILYE